MFYYVYILYSKKLDIFYRGYTSDVSNRLERHNSGYEISTSPGVPWILVWQTTKNSRSEAMDLENKLKNLSRRRLIRFMLKYKESIVDSGIKVFLQDLVN